MGVEVFLGPEMGVEVFFWARDGSGGFFGPEMGVEVFFWGQRWEWRFFLGQRWEWRFFFGARNGSGGGLGGHEGVDEARCRMQEPETSSIAGHIKLASF